MKRKRKGLTHGISLAIALCMLLCFTACKKVALYHNLDEANANDIIVALYSAGIDAEKEKEIVQNEIFWTVSVDQKNLPEARKLLVDRNLPKVRELGLSGVYQEKGLIPTPDEQKARFLLAVKGEIVNSLESLPEVVNADVVINVPTPEEFAGDQNKRPTASLVLKVRPEAKTVSQLTESKLQQFVANSVENLNPRDVSVIISYMTVPTEEEGKTPTKLMLPQGETVVPEGTLYGDMVKIAGVTVAKGSAFRLKIYLMVFFVILILMSAVLIINMVRTTRMRHEFQALTEGGNRPLIEGEFAEAPPRLGKGEDEE